MGIKKVQKLKHKWKRDEDVSICQQCGFVLTKYQEDPLPLCQNSYYKRLESLANKECSEKWTEYHWRSANDKFLSYRIKMGYEDYPNDQ